MMLLATLCVYSSDGQSKMPENKIKIGQQELTVEVANTDKDRQVGLMNRKKLGAQDGMLFIFDDNRPYCMWMKNTLIPLSVAFADECGNILNIEDMLPQTDEQHCALGNARFALEMNKGWFEQHKISPGMRIETGLLCDGF
ncbi:hypothetical protein CUC53_09805 [Aeromonas cavernicola]|uniref:DUF192 domain-containing protein n=2 Tax=Aeromonas cavernicola TaxID=1006623 RepID=A0A2H9U4L3_9GAMM|nr:hypothetical protein CUC53_09805 [Aeromonas cavernicola]